MIAMRMPRSNLVQPSSVTLRAHRTGCARTDQTTSWPRLGCRLVFGAILAVWTLVGALAVVANAVPSAVAAPAADTVSTTDAPTDAGKEGARVLPSARPDTTRSWALAQFGAPRYAPDMPHWPYVNPDAPQGGHVTLGVLGSFDSLNTLILRGQWPAGLGMISDSLMVSSGDELATVYGLIAESAEYPPDKSWVVFHLRPEARWHDGVPITAQDFHYAFTMIRALGRPFLKSFYDDVVECEVLGPHTLRFSFRTRNSMKPLLAVAGLSPLPQHWWTANGRDIRQTTLEPVLGNGPYRIKSVDPGRSITYQRVANYWAWSLPVVRGMHNFSEIKYDYYLDDSVLFEAFMSGRIDFRQENRAQRWASAYNTDDVRLGRIVRREPPDHGLRGMYGYVFNQRRAQFQDIRVRKALNYLYDFETIQRSLLYGRYRRILSWFPNSDYGSQGTPTDDERRWLEPHAAALSADVLERRYTLPTGDGNGPNRANLREAMRLLKEAGWNVRDGQLVHGRNGKPFSLEILLSSPTLERVTQSWVQMLRRAGIDAKIRIVDSSQYRVRLDHYDYDIVVIALNFFAPPGPELRAFFHSSVVDVRGQGNFAGIRDTVVDHVLDDILAADNLPAIESATRALDRVLLWNWAVIPLWYNDISWLAFWDRFAWPDTMARYTHGFPSTWWVVSEKNNVLPVAR